MADLVINGTTYSGSPTNTANPQRPNELRRKRRKYGRTLEAADGTTTLLYRATKLTFTITWNKANQVTQTAVRTIRDLSTAFSFTSFDGVVYTVVTATDDEYEETIVTDKANNYQFDLTLILREV